MKWTWILIAFVLAMPGLYGAAGNGCGDGDDDDDDDGGVVHKGFETGDFSQGWYRELAEDYSGQVVTDVVRCGQYAARFEMREGDENWRWTGFRAEVSELLDFIAPLMSEQWYGFSTYIPADWIDLDNRAVISQWHATPDLGEGEVWRSPPLALRYRNGELSVTSRSSEEKVQEQNAAPEFVRFTYPNFPKGVWHDWVFHVRWDYRDDGDGFIEAWLDGEKVIDYVGPVGYNDNAGLWFKWGIYRDDVAATQYLYHDEYRRGGASFADVDPAQCDD
ncbi:polysaccharide lyase [bacterium]|nr:polysaccharide lyase [bacterium]